MSTHYGTVQTAVGLALVPLCGARRMQGLRHTPDLRYADYSRMLTSRTPVWPISGCDAPPHERARHHAAMMRSDDKAA